VKRHEQKLHELVENLDRCLTAFHDGDAQAFVAALEDHIVRSFELRDLVREEPAPASANPQERTGHHPLSIVRRGTR
jgi:hypothetical protein